MSTSTDSSLVSEAASTVTLNYCGMSVIALLMYYCLTTLDDEFKHYSSRKFTLATLLYIANRYIPLAYALYTLSWIGFSSEEKMYPYLCLFILQMRPLIPWHFDSCAVEWGIGVGVEDLQYFPWAIFSALRTYALQRKLYWAIIVFMLSLASVFVSAMSSTIAILLSNLQVDSGSRSGIIGRWVTRMQSKAVYCRYPIPYPCGSSGARIAPILARVPMIIADIIVIIITWRTQYKTHSLSKELPAPTSLTTIVLRDGEELKDVLQEWQLIYPSGTLYFV
ncbi:hypothetical protein C8Q70DRAFT_930225 [Cubamyces menziesii]|nr:hypothetical protein C8Q70DRAFT_930225 [Cubamyces menziesii]